MSGDNFDRHDWGGEAATTIQWVKARDAAEHPTVCSMAPIQRTICLKYH